MKPHLNALELLQRRFAGGNVFCDGYKEGRSVDEEGKTRSGRGRDVNGILLKDAKKPSPRGRPGRPKGKGGIRKTTEEAPLPPEEDPETQQMEREREYIRETEMACKTLEKISSGLDAPESPSLTEDNPKSNSVDAEASSPEPLALPLMQLLTTPSQPKITYTSVTKKPICLCIIWVHLQASVTSEWDMTEGRNDARGHPRRHRCMITQAPKPVTHSNMIHCHHCTVGYLSYSQYLSHLYRSPCGQRQMHNNRASPQSGTIPSPRVHPVYQPPGPSKDHQWAKPPPQPPHYFDTPHQQQMALAYAASRKRKHDWEMQYYQSKYPFCPPQPPFYLPPRFPPGYHQYGPRFHPPHYPPHLRWEGWPPHGPHPYPHGYYPSPPVQRFPPTQPSNPPWAADRPGYQPFHPAASSFNSSDEGFWQRWNENPPTAVSGPPPLCVTNQADGTSTGAVVLGYEQSTSRLRVPEYEQSNSEQFGEGGSMEWISKEQNIVNASQVVSTVAPTDDRPGRDMPVFTDDDQITSTADESVQPGEMSPGISAAGIANLAGLASMSGLRGLAGLIGLTPVAEHEDEDEDLRDQLEGVFGQPRSPVSSTTETAHSEDIPDEQDDPMETYLKEGSEDPVLTATADLGRPPQTNGETSNVVVMGEDTITLHYALEENTAIQNEGLFDDMAASESLLLLAESGEGICTSRGGGEYFRKSEYLEDHSKCPHTAVSELGRVGFAEQARDQLRLITLQAQLAYVLLGLLGERILRKFGYPSKGVIQILYEILDSAKIKVVEETYLCGKECKTMRGLCQKELSYRLIKLRIRVLRANVGKLLCLCVPARSKWREFGWDGKTVDDILDELCKEEIKKVNHNELMLQEQNREEPVVTEAVLYEAAATTSEELFVGDGTNVIVLQDGDDPEQRTFILTSNGEAALLTDNQLEIFEAVPATMETVPATMEAVSASMEAVSASMEGDSASMEGASASMVAVPTSVVAVSASMEAGPASMEQMVAVEAVEGSLENPLVEEIPESSKVSAIKADKEAKLEETEETNFVVLNEGRTREGDGEKEGDGERTKKKEEDTYGEAEDEAELRAEEKSGELKLN